MYSQITVRFNFGHVMRISENLKNAKYTHYYGNSHIQQYGRHYSSVDYTDQ